MTPDEGHDTPLLMTADAAEAYSGIPAQTLRYLHRMRQLPALIVGRRMMWTRAAVLRFIKEKEGRAV